MSSHVNARPLSVIASSIVLALGLAACTSDTSSDDSAPAPAPAPTTSPAPSAPSPVNASNPATVLIRGTLAGDAASSKKQHDGLAANAKTRANALGDVGHFTFVGAQDGKQFLSIDRWTSLEGLNSFFTDRDVSAGFAGFYTAPPKVTPYIAPHGWVTWGDLDYRSHGKVTAVTIHGHLASADAAASQKVHDGAAGGSKDIATGKGDVAHNVFLGVTDPREFVAVDYWSDPAAIQAFYANPQLIAAFGALLDAPPEITVQVSTDWVQW